MCSIYIWACPLLAVQSRSLSHLTMLHFSAYHRAFQHQYTSETSAVSLISMYRSSQNQLRPQKLMRQRASGALSPLSSHLSQ